MKDLYYTDGENYLALPEWGKFYLRLGSIIASKENAEKRYIIGLAIPTRAFAAALTAAGVVAARSKVPVRPEAPEEYFEQLVSLPAGTAVSIQNKNRKLKGYILGSKYVYDGPRIGVQVENARSGGLTHWIPPKDSLRIELSASQISRLPKRQKGARAISPGDIADQNRLVRHFLDGIDWFDFVTHSRRECAVLGTVSVLREEIQNTPFAVRSSDGDTFVEGSLLNVLRVREYSSAGQSYRSRVFSVNNQKLPQIADVDKPAVTVFDGGAGFVKWRENWRGANWVVLLDRTERYFFDAAAALNQEYIQNRIDGDELDEFTDVPPGVELVSFTEAAP